MSESASQCEYCRQTITAYGNRFCGRVCYAKFRSKQKKTLADLYEEATEAVCGKCGFKGAKSLFAKRSRSRLGHEPVCKKCRQKHITEWRKNNPDKVKAYNKRATENVGGQTFWKYGVTSQQFEQMIALQGGGCGICSRTKPAVKLCIDHDHKTGVVRGVLCRNCNTALGKFQENPLLLHAAVMYLQSCQVMNDVAAETGAVPFRLWIDDAYFQSVKEKQANAS